MARWEPDAPRRLREAALELYAERGYENTTAADIADRAGLNRRTFFRHFADKREALFWGSEALQDWHVTAIEAADPASAPLDMIIAGLRVAGLRFEERRPDVLRRQAILDATPELRERERTKLAALTTAIADALKRKGLSANTADLVAAVGVALQHHCFVRWVDPANTKPWEDHLSEALAELSGIIPERVRP